MSGCSFRVVLCSVSCSRQGEEVATLYEGPVHTALKATAVLLMAAAEFLAVKPSPLLLLLISADDAANGEHV